MVNPIEGSNRVFTSPTSTNATQQQSSASTSGAQGSSPAGDSVSISPDAVVALLKSQAADFKAELPEIVAQVLSQSMSGSAAANQVASAFSNRVENPILNALGSLLNEPGSRPDLVADLRVDIQSFQLDFAVSIEFRFQAESDEQSAKEKLAEIFAALNEIIENLVLLLQFLEQTAVE